MFFAGVEYGFTSTTTDRKVAQQYANGQGDPNQSKMLYEMRMGMVSRGACLTWLSQYPEEKEILLPPLLAIELLGCESKADGTLVCSMDLNCNLQTKTIEQVLAIRKEQCVELADVIERGVADQCAESHARHNSINSQWYTHLKEFLKRSMLDLKITMAEKVPTTMATTMADRQSDLAPFAASLLTHSVATVQGSSAAQSATVCAVQRERMLHGDDLKLGRKRPGLLPRVGRQVWTASRRKLEGRGWCVTRDSDSTYHTGCFV